MMNSEDILQITFPETNNAENEDEIKALVPLLPENWPQKFNSTRPKSCKSTTIGHTRVNKAQAHLELLQNAVEDWLCALQRHSPSSFISTMSMGKTTSTSMSGREPALEVVGTGAAGGPQMGADVVIRESMALLGRLETERESTEDSIETERKQVLILADKIERLSWLRMNEIPVAVQREHELCADDIAELQWHVEKQLKERKKVLKKKNRAEEINGKLKEEMRSMRDQEPQLKDKIELEKHTVGNINAARQQTDTELTGAVQRMETVDGKFNETVQSAEAEREAMKKEIARARKQLQNAKTNLANSEKEHDRLVRDIAVYEKKKEVTSARVTKVSSENANIMRVSNDIQTRVGGVRNNLNNLLNTKKQLLEENVKLTRELNSTKAQQETQRRNRENEYNSTDDKLSMLRRQNKELVMEIGDMEKKLVACKEKKESDMKGADRIRREIEETRAESDGMEEEIERVALLHNDVTQKMKDMEKKVRQTEDHLRGQLAHMNKQMKDEIKTRSTIQARMKTDAHDLEKFKVEAEAKRKKMKMMALECEKAVQELLPKVVELRNKHDVSSKIVADLQATLDGILAEQNAFSADLNAQIADLTPSYTKVKEDLGFLERRLEHMDWQTNLMKNKLEDMMKAAYMITKTKGKVEEAINQLQDQLRELLIQQQSGQREEDGIRHGIQATQARMTDNENYHRRFIQDREDVEKNLKTSLQEAYERNKDMAGKYRSLQTEYLELRDRYLDVTHEIVQLEAKVKDLKQVHQLQSQLHHALGLFLSYKKAYMEGEFDRMSEESSFASHRVHALQAEMTRAMKDISAFLDKELHCLLTGQRLLLADPQPHEEEQDESESMESSEI